LFRHSFATRQLEQGIPLKVIGDILGHRNSQTTGIYVRSALSRLRRLALPVPT
jgi:site-specific recombinase XerD